MAIMRIPATPRTPACVALLGTFSPKCPQNQQGVGRGGGHSQDKSAADPALASATDWQEQVDALAQCSRRHIAHRPCAEPGTTCSLRLPEDQAHMRNGSRRGGHTGLWKAE